jgi:hypothetical protein
MNYFRRRVRLNPSYLNSWERRTFGQPIPLWLWHAELVYLAIGGIVLVLWWADMLVDLWDEAPVVSVVLALPLCWLLIVLCWLLIEAFARWIGRTLVAIWEAVPPPVLQGAQKALDVAILGFVVRWIDQTLDAAPVIRKILFIRGIGDIYGLLGLVILFLALWAGLL